MSSTLPSWARIPLHRASLSVPELDAQAPSSRIPRSPVALKSDQRNGGVHGNPARDALFLETEQHRFLQSMYKEIELLKAENRGSLCVCVCVRVHYRLDHSPLILCLCMYVRALSLVCPCIFWPCGLTHLFRLEV